MSGTSITTSTTSVTLPTFSHKTVKEKSFLKNDFKDNKPSELSFKFSNGYLLMAILENVEKEHASYRR